MYLLFEFEVIICGNKAQLQQTIQTKSLESHWVNFDHIQKDH